MINVNILYDGQYSDVDIISIPQTIEHHIGLLAQEYLDWIPPDDDVDNWVVLNGIKCISKGADGFVNWLNSVYCLENKACVIKRNVPICTTYPTVEF